MSDTEGKAMRAPRLPAATRPSSQDTIAVMADARLFGFLPSLLPTQYRKDLMRRARTLLIAAA